MGPEAIMAIKLLTDVIITTTTTLQRVSEMEAEEVTAAIADAEAMLDITRQRYQERNRPEGT